MYLSSIGLSLVCAAIVLSVLENNKFNKYKIGNHLLVSYILILSGITYQYCHVWKDEISLWSNAIQEHPSSLRTSVAYFNRAVAYERRGNDLRALNDYSDALRIYPDFSEASANRAKLLSHANIIHYPIRSNDR